MKQVHRLTVDAYAAQHPGLPERRAIQSVWAHLIGLYLGLELGLSPGFVRRVMASLASEADGLTWLTPPASLGVLTIADVAAAPDSLAHGAIVGRWAAEVWRAWGEHHAGVRSVADGLVARL